MEEIRIKEIFNFLKTKIGKMIIITLIVLNLGLVYSIFVKEPMYRSTSTIVLATTNSLSDSLQNDITTNQKLVSTYKEFIKSRSVLEATIDDLDLDMKYETLYNMVEVNSVSNTEVIKISVIDEDAKEAKEIVTSVTSEFAKVVSEFYDTDNIKILDDASTPGNPYNINILLELIMYFSIGLFISVGIFVIRFYLDTTVKTALEVEMLTNLPVIGTIPFYDGKDGKK